MLNDPILRALLDELAHARDASVETWLQRHKEHVEDVVCFIPPWSEKEHDAVYRCGRCGDQLGTKIVFERNARGFVVRVIADPSTLPHVCDDECIR